MFWMLYARRLVYFYSTLEDHFFVFKGAFLKPYVWLVIQEWVIMVCIRYVILFRKLSFF